MIDELYRPEGDGYVVLTPGELASYRQTVETIKAQVGVGDEVEGDLHSLTSYLATYQEAGEEGEEPIIRQILLSLPVVLTADEIEDYFQRIKDAATALPPVPEVISDRQFFHALAVLGMITEAEALQAVKTGDPPAAMDAFLSSLPDDQEFGARMLLEGATTFQRSHPLTLAFAAGMNMTAEQTDDLWRLAASL